jgi:RNA polymerase sigma factor (sigma-70 family)
MPALILEDDTIAALERIHAGQVLENALAHLPDHQAEAVRARIVDEREYDDIARELRTSEAVVRKRVSRGLSTLRRQVEDHA